MEEKNESISLATFLKQNLVCEYDVVIDVPFNKLAEKIVDSFEQECTYLADKYPVLIQPMSSRDWRKNRRNRQRAFQKENELRELGWTPKDLEQHPTLQNEVQEAEKSVSMNRELDSTLFNECGKCISFAFIRTRYIDAIDPPLMHQIIAIVYRELSQRKSEKSQKSSRVLLSWMDHKASQQSRETDSDEEETE